jgi:hypothetical protein
MTTLLEIEAAIKQLPESDVRKLAAWLQTYLDETWDRQIEEDLTSGKLDNLIAQAEADIAQDYEEAVEGIERGLDAFEAGRFRSFAEFVEEQRRKYKLPTNL